MFHVKRLPMKTLINWKVFWMLLGAAILTTILLLPYAMEAQSSAIDLTKLPIPLPLLLTLQIAQNAILFAIAIFAGLFFARRVGLGAPILDSVTRGEPVAQRVRAVLPLSVILGVVSTLVVLGLEFFYFQPVLARQLSSTASELNLRTSNLRRGKASWHLSMGVL